MKFRIVFWDVLPCKIIVDRRFRGAHIPEDNSEILLQASKQIILLTIMYTKLNGLHGYVTKPEF
jgi:hypothetical protein